MSKIVGQPTLPSIDVNQLSKEELEFVLTILKEVTITGMQVEMFYNLILKLQNQYVDRSK
jgi:hypothetical protein